MSSVAGMMALTGSLSGVAVADGIYNYTVLDTEMVPNGQNPGLDGSTLSSSYIGQPGTLSSMSGTGRDRYIVLQVSAQSFNTSANPAVDSYAELGGYAMTRAALDVGNDSNRKHSTDLHYLKYNSAGTPTIQWRKATSNHEIWAQGSVCYSFEVPEGAALTVNTAEGTGNGINQTYTLDTSGKPRMVFVGLFKGNDSWTQTITEGGSSIVEFSGDAATNELMAFGAEDENNITGTTVEFSQVQNSANNECNIVVEFVQQ